MMIAVGEVEILWCGKAEVKDNGGLASTVEGLCGRFVAHGYAASYRLPSRPRRILRNFRRKSRVFVLSQVVAMEVEQTEHSAGLPMDIPI